MAFRSGTSAFTGFVGSPITLAAPAGVAAGDLLVAFIIVGAIGATAGGPTGWTAAQVGGDYVLQVFTKVATASEPSSYQFSGSPAYAVIWGTIVDYTGLGFDNAAGVTHVDSGDTLAAPAVTTTLANELVVAMWFQANNGQALTLPGGVTSRFTSTFGSTNGYIVVGDYAGPGTPGSSSPGSATIGLFAPMVSTTFCFRAQLPLTPTLLLPANGATIDIASGYTFTWQYNTGGAAGGQTGYQMRMRRSGGSYGYWNGTNFSSSTPVNNTTANQFVAIPAAVQSDGFVYNWSIATIDANGTGPFAADNTFTAYAAPSVTVSAPTGTITTQTPTVSWTDSLASGTTQSTYRVVTYSAAQYGAGGFTPGVGPSLDDSGVVTSAGLSYTTGILPNLVVRSYVQISVTPGGQTSAWVFTGYTVNATLPTTPTATAIPSNDPVTGLPLIALTINATAGNTVVVLRSDGLYVRGASTANPAPVPGGGVVSLVDAEITPSVSYSYDVVQYDATTGNASADVNTGNAMIAAGQGWWEFDPTDLTTAVNANAINWNPTATEQSSPHPALGQKTMNVVAYAMQNPDFVGTFEVFDAATYAGLLALALSQQTIFISDPFGATVPGYYYRLGLPPGGLASGSGSTAHSTTLLPSTASGPHRTVDLTGIAQPRPAV